MLPKSTRYILSKDKFLIKDIFISLSDNEMIKVYYFVIFQQQ